MTSTSQSKKHKTEQQHDDDTFETVKRYLLECPHVPNDHPAVLAAVEGLEKEQKRRDRDLKLQAKFTNQTSTSTSTSSTSKAADSSDDVVLVGETATMNPYQRLASTTTSNSNNNHSNTDDSDIMEWQDVQAAKRDQQEQQQEEEDPSSFLGKQLSQLAIQDMAHYHVQVSSPLAAIAVVLHACLRSELLGFSCTGIPPSTGLQSSSAGGFAPPIRELPKTTFLPPNWDEDTTTIISLRYRKPTIGALVLSVTLDEEGDISIQIIRNQEPHGESLSFPLGDHINFHSWNAAKKSSNGTTGNGGIGIAPALHYKALHQLVTNMLRTFDLGVMDSDEQGAQAHAAAPYVDTTVVYSSTTASQGPYKSEIAPSEPESPWQQGVPATIQQAFGRGFPTPRGDFADDLTPGGLRDPLRDYSGGRMGGNMMGPNHPMFHSGPGPLGTMGGPGSMQPRFDPFLPPGVDPPDGVEPDTTTRTHLQGRPRARRYPGEPNPDHLPPPNGFGGGDMFS
jgi:hypothetical protein